MFCPVPWFSSKPMDEEFTIIKKQQEEATPQTPKVEKVQDTADLTAATEAMTPGEVSSVTSSEDSLSSGSEANADTNASPIKPQALVFEEPAKETIVEEKETPSVSSSSSLVKYILLALIFAFLSQSGNLFPKRSLSVEQPVMESQTIETPVTIEETAVDVDIDAEVKVDVNTVMEEAEAAE